MMESVLMSMDFGLLMMLFIYFAECVAACDSRLSEFRDVAGVMMKQNR